MVLFDRFDFGSDGPDEPSITDDDLAELRGECNWVVSQLRDQHFAATTRTAIAEEIESLLAAATTLTTAELEAPIPEQSPPTSVLANCVAALSGALVTDNLPADATHGDVADLATLIDDVQAAVRAAATFPYEYDELETDTRYGKELISKGVTPTGETELFAGPYARRLIDNAREAPEQPLWIGTGTRDGRDAAIEKKFLFRHLGIFGVTGYGKSTLLKNAFRQLVDAGFGGCFIDPKGDDSEELMEILPAHRLDDVIWIEPGSTREHVSGFNFLDVGLPPDDPNYDTAVEALVSDLVKMLGADEYWGPRMDRVARNLIRGMHESQYEFNLIDMYYVLSSEESRQQFAALVREEGLEFVQEYTSKIAALDDDDLEPLLGRFQPWVENRLARRMVAFREAQVNIPEAVEQGKILIVRMGSEDKDLKRMLGMAVIRRIWATVRARAERKQAARAPFYLFVDEFDNIALEDETIPTMLSESRSYRLALTFCCQYPGQLPDNVIEGMLVNCDTLLSFNPGSKAQAKDIAPKLDLDRQHLLNEVNYHVWMRITLNETMEKSDSFRVYTYPPYPPVRSTAEADDLIDQSLRRHGRPKKTDRELKGELLFDHGRGLLEGGAQSDAAALIDDAEDRDAAGEGHAQAGTSVDADVARDGADGTVESATEGQFAPSQRDTVLESIFAARIQADVQRGTFEPGRWVPLADAKRELTRRLGEDATLGTSLSELAHAYEAITDQYARTAQRSGEPMARLTADGRAILFQQDTGSSGAGGSMKHRLVLRAAYTVFTTLGYDVSLPTQGGEELPDGLAESPVNPASKETMREIRAAREELKAEYPAVWELSEGRDVSIEAETSTQTYPHQTFRNLRKAIDQNTLCVYATPDGERDKGEFTYWARRLAKVHFRADPDDTLQFGEFAFTEHETADGRELLYSAGEDYTVTVNGTEKKAVRPTPAQAAGDVPENAASTKWYRDLETGAYMMCYAVNRAPQRVCARFPDADAVATDGAAHVPAYYEYDHTAEEYVVYTSDGEKKHYGTQSQFEQHWETFTAPFIPEVEFPREPTEDDFVILIIPDADSAKNQPHVYHHGETTPLFDELDASADTLTLPAGATTVDLGAERDSMSEPAESTDDSKAALAYTLTIAAERAHRLAAHDPHRPITQVDLDELPGVGASPSTTASISIDEQADMAEEQADEAGEQAEDSEFWSQYS